jgi:hypothetical protein
LFGAADTSGMLDFERDELAASTDWQRLLACYRDGRDAAKQADPEFAGWLERVMAVEGIEDGVLPRLHGKLIALGFLKFQLAGRSEGVRYQITSDGVRALDGLLDGSLDGAEPDAEPEELDEVDAEPAVIPMRR